MTPPAHLGDEILNAWIDGVATDEERAIVDDHLAACETCEQRLGELQLVKAMLGDLGEVAPPRSFRLTPEQAKQPTPIRPRDTGTNVVRLLPIVRALSVAAMLAVLILGGALALRPESNSLDDSATSTMSFGMMPAGETGNSTGSLEEETRDETTLARGEVVDQGESASAHDSTSNAIADQAQDEAAASSEAGLSGLEVATITTGVLAMLLGMTWMGLSMSIRNGESH
jgi:hypothetical protein